eukprot:447163-Amphidinium_carterae.3
MQLQLGNLSLGPVSGGCAAEVSLPKTNSHANSNGSDYYVQCSWAVNIFVTEKYVAVVFVLNQERCVPFQTKVPWKGLFSCCQLGITSSLKGSPRQAVNAYAPKQWTWFPRSFFGTFFYNQSSGVAIFATRLSCKACLREGANIYVNLCKVARSYLLHFRKGNLEL